MAKHNYHSDVVAELTELFPPGLFIRITIVSAFGADLIAYSSIDGTITRIVDTDVAKHYSKEKNDAVSHFPSVLYCNPSVIHSMYFEGTDPTVCDTIPDDLGGKWITVRLNGVAPNFADDHLRVTQYARITGNAINPRTPNASSGG